MLLTCSSCNSKYLVNSADLKPNGRKVRSSLNVDNNQLKQNKKSSYSLPSTYIKEEKVSILNSFLVLLFLIIFVFGVWLIKREGTQIIILLNYYIQEFYFSLKLIITDLAKLMNQIIN